VNVDKYGIHGIFAITISIQISSAKTAKNHSISQKGVAEVWQKSRAINDKKSSRIHSDCFRTAVSPNLHTPLSDKRSRTKYIFLYQTDKNRVF